MSVLYIRNKDGGFTPVKTVESEGLTEEEVKQSVVAYLNANPLVRVSDIIGISHPIGGGSVKKHGVQIEGPEIILGEGVFTINSATVWDGADGKPGLSICTFDPDKGLSEDGTLDTDFVNVPDGYFIKDNDLLLAPNGDIYRAGVKKDAYGIYLGYTATFVFNIKGEHVCDGGGSAFDPTAYGLPILYLTGDTTGMSKDDAVSLGYVYGERSGTATVKWQGSSSLAYPKKNYTIKFDNAFEAVEGWGVQDKYCLKANWIDHSHARNVVSAKLWGEVVKSRTNANSKLNDLPNGGAVDGFPCIIMLNGVFHGLYTFNIPKDGWMFGMGNNGQTTVTETFGFGSWIVADSFNQSTGEYAPTSSVSTYFVSQRSPAIGGRAYCTWDNQKVAELAVRAHIFDEAGNYVKVLGWTAAYDGKSGDFGEDALREPGNAEYLWIKDSISIPVPDSGSVIWEFWVPHSTKLPDGTLTNAWSEEAEANGTWVYAWVKTGIEFSLVSTSAPKEVILCADSTSEATRFNTEAIFSGDFDLEYASETVNEEDAFFSLNRLITACINSNGTDLDSTIANYLDWDSAIDYYIFTCLIGGMDMGAKNYLLSTYDGTKWFFGAYDMDSTFGLWWDGSKFLPDNHYPTVEWYANYHKVMGLIWNYKRGAFKARYAELRAGALSENNVALAFSNFISRIPSTVYAEDTKKWPSIPSTAANNLAQILNWYRMRAAAIDKEVAGM